LEQHIFKTFFASFLNIALDQKKIIELRLEFSTDKAVVQLQRISAVLPSRKSIASARTIEGKKHKPKVYVTKKQDFAKFNSLRNRRFLFISDIPGWVALSPGLLPIERLFLVVMKIFV
jgi:hypothetical protein